jgi:hypothetical protein
VIQIPLSGGSSEHFGFDVKNPKFSGLFFPAAKSCKCVVAFVSRRRFRNPDWPEVRAGSLSPNFEPWMAAVVAEPS